MTEKEYNECVNQYADNVYRFILKNLKHAANAEDVVQSAFQALWEQRAEVQAATAKSLLFTIAYRKMIDHIRRHKRVVYEESMTSYEKGAEQRVPHLKEVLNQALERLDETKRSLVLLKDYEGYSYGEIGTITGLSASQVKVYLHRARLQLKEYLVKIENII
ncbi:RNA polymerase subunit sigma-24 [Niabella ginsenosidivorans]|uniref:RNA polymerase subunit sigma-24 n=1 Tax=Niabella ginsenosidivorans TaxID=1176587 RepID=A0A1A9I615_9BACT|nr:RNA polymerase sigma factor [Niabella ginsenosidivorans]ANH82499.1 RNA polymerase subunit sigma-24 [Niabella ginsenosidivorans]